MLFQAFMQSLNNIIKILCFSLCLLLQYLLLNDFNKTSDPSMITDEDIQKQEWGGVRSR